MLLPGWLAMTWMCCCKGPKRGQSTYPRLPLPARHACDCNPTPLPVWRHSIKLRLNAAVTSPGGHDADPGGGQRIRRGPRLDVDTRSESLPVRRRYHRSKGCGKRTEGDGADMEEKRVQAARECVVEGIPAGHPGRPVSRLGERWGTLSSASRTWLETY